MNIITGTEECFDCSNDSARFIKDRHGYTFECDNCGLVEEFDWDEIRYNYESDWDVYADIYERDLEYTYTE